MVEVLGDEEGHGLGVVFCPAPDDEVADFDGLGRGGGFIGLGVAGGRCRFRDLAAKTRWSTSRLSHHLDRMQQRRHDQMTPVDPTSCSLPRDKPRLKLQRPNTLSRCVGICSITSPKNKWHNSRESRHRSSTITIRWGNPSCPATERRRCGCRWQVRRGRQGAAPAL